MYKEQIKALSEIEVYPAELYGKNVYFTDERVKVFPLNKGIYKYEIRHDDNSYGDPCELSTKILVNFYGTIISQEPISLSNTSLNGFKYIDMTPEDLYVEWDDPIPVLDVFNNMVKQYDEKTNKSS